MSAVFADGGVSLCKQPHVMAPAKFSPLNIANYIDDMSKLSCLELVLTS